MIKGNTPVWSDPESIETQLPQLVSAAHKKNVKVLTSIGGWTGSLTFRYDRIPLFFLSFSSVCSQHHGQKSQFSKGIHPLVYSTHEKVYIKKNQS